MGLLEKGLSSATLNVLRLTLALLVVVYHSFLFYGHRSSEWLYVLTQGQKESGKLAVDLFFILSGYLIVQSRERSKSLWIYLRKRALRIYPAFVVAILLSILAGYVGAADRSTYFSMDWLRVIFGTAVLTTPQVPPIFQQAVYSKGMLNGSLWSIPYEAGCYLALAGFWACTRLPRAPLAWAIFGLSYLVLIQQHMHGWFPDLPFLPWPQALAGFFSGVLVYLHRDRLRLGWSLGLLALGLTVIASWFNGLYLVLPLTAPFMIFSLATIKMPERLKHVDISYGVYVYAIPVQQLMLLWLGPTLHPLTHAGLTILVLVPIAAISWFGIEKPMKGLKLKPLRNAIRNERLAGIELSPAESLGSRTTCTALQGDCIAS